MNDSKKGNTPSVQGHHISLDDCPKTSEEKAHMSKIPYASVVAILMYAMLCTCLDICFAIGMSVDINRILA